MVTEPIVEMARSGPLPPAVSTREEYIRYLRDPRREFEGDTRLWQSLLSRAASESQQVHAALHCIRCGGARLAMEDGHLKFQPRFIDPRVEPRRGTAWETHDDFKIDCEDILGPHEQVIGVLLKSMERDVQLPPVKDVPGEYTQG